MQQGRGGMGSHKHGVSGHSPKSPRLKHRMKREAEANERKAKAPLAFSSLHELFSKERK